MVALRRWRALLALLALVVLALVVGRQVARYGEAHVVAGPDAPTGWKTIEYDGLRVDLPAGWDRFDRGDCEFDFEQWAPPQTASCDGGEGLAFYVSATFDPAHGPGVRRADPSEGVPWSGWTDASGTYEVYAAGPRRDLVERVLDSVRDD